MLHIQKITLENFGPYKGTQSIELAKDNGVSIVYGENMRGKTYLLNAIRYTLFGKVVSRGSRQISLHDIGNWESRAAGRYGFQVDLYFESDGHQYQLTRLCRPKAGVTQPENDSDYDQEVFLRRDGDILGPTQRDTELARLMPEQVSRFFLFDGELLQEYEELLRDESEMGHRITEAIERILGVPVLTSARAHMRDLEKTAQQQESRAAQKDQKTRELGNLIANQTEQRTHHENELERYRDNLEDLKGQKASLEVALRKTERVKALLDERDNFERDIKDINQRLAEREEKLRDVMGDAWRGMLRSRIEAVRGSLQTQIDELRDRVTRSAVSRELLERIQQSLSDNACLTCSRPLDNAAKGHLSATLATLQPSGSEETETYKLDELMRISAILGGFDAQDKRDLVRELSGTIDELRVDKADKEERVGELNEQTSRFDQSEIRAQHAEHEKVIKDIALVEQGIKAAEEKLKGIDENIRGLQRELEKKGGADIAKERARREIYSRLRDLFDEGVSVYRDRLRTKVEKDATELFTKLTSEPEYKGLAINENYGLTIVHEDGELIPVRSAGAEHIVALSLMGALQKNAPLRGPIIMDSPFGRLDEVHTTKVIQALPSMADQVMLLVYETELKPQVARNELRGKLRDEYRMMRRSARHTSLERFAEA